MQNIFLYAPSIASNNIGDAIIVQGVKDALKELLEKSYVIEMPTHTPLSSRYALFLGNPDMKIVCGSNILTGKLNQIRHVKQWALGYTTTWQLKNSLFIGVGAQKYQGCNIYTKNVYKKMFGMEYVHSVRDEYTKKFLNDVGIFNVLNTGCPTMWGLTQKHCSKIPYEQSEQVVLTLTDYSKDKKRDEFLISVLLQKYKKVFFWAQGNRDYEYFTSLAGHEKIELLSPRLEAYDAFLEKVDVDFVGTRLHGGMRALQKGRRTLIIGIDNRANELHKDFNIPVLHQNRIEELPQIIQSSYKTEIHLNTENIRKFLAQFKIMYAED